MKALPVPLRSVRECLRPRVALCLAHAREYLTHDSAWFKAAVAFLGLGAAAGLWAWGAKRRGIATLAAIHRANCLAVTNRLIEAIIANTLKQRGTQRRVGDTSVYRIHIETLRRTSQTAKLFEDPARLLGSRVLVLKSPRPNERGVILVDYSYVLPLFARFFDTVEIAKRYFIVLEPTWSGYCDLDILCYTAFDFPVFVEAIEPRDEAFIRGLASNLIVVPTSGNWWVDHRVFRTLPGVPKDVDVVMVAAWARFKRHAKFFRGLRELRRRGERLKTVLVGYPVDLSLRDIASQAKIYGVDDQIEIFEWLSPEEVNHQLNRAKVNVLWSRKEGFNRAIIEGMFADLPCVMRRGFNHGYRYPYMNPATGCFAEERELPDRLLWMIRNHGQFAPRQWVMKNMTCQTATRIVSETLKRVACEAGESWTEDLAVKVCHLNTMRYWNGQDRQRFEKDYEFLLSMRRTC